jgi:hypothetical protein
VVCEPCNLAPYCTCGTSGQEYTVDNAATKKKGWVDRHDIYYDELKPDDFEAMLGLDIFTCFPNAVNVTDAILLCTLNVRCSHFSASSQARMARCSAKSAHHEDDFVRPSQKSRRVWVSTLFTACANRSCVHDRWRLLRQSGLTYSMPEMETGPYMRDNGVNILECYHDPASIVSLQRFVTAISLSSQSWLSARSTARSQTAPLSTGT